MNVPEAVTTVCQALITDEGYRIGWQANIAMAFYDEFRNTYGGDAGIDELGEIANRAAVNFLSRLCETPLKDARAPAGSEGDGK